MDWIESVFEHVGGGRYCETLVVACDWTAMNAAMSHYQSRHHTHQVRANILAHEHGGVVCFAHTTGHPVQVAGARPVLLVLLGVTGGSVVEEARKRAICCGGRVVEAPEFDEREALLDLVDRLREVIRG